MGVINTKRNFVCAYDALPGDAYIATYINGSERRYLLLTQPIDEYGPTLEWALSIADRMERPLEIITLTEAEYVSLLLKQIERGGPLTDQDHAALRDEAASLLAKVLRDSDNPAIRAEAHGLLVRMGVLR